MIRLYFKRKPYSLPTRWDEFTPEHGPLFRRMACVMADFELGRREFDSFTVALTLAILNIRRIPAFTDELSENLFRLGEHFTFPYTIRIREDNTREASVQISISENLLPKINGIKGYDFRREPSGRMECSLTAEQYIDALSLMQAWQSTRQISALENMVRGLYPGIARVSEEDALAVYYNFRGILSWIKSIPSYAIIFPPEEYSRPGSGHNPVGLASSIFALAKAGYGDINTIKELPLFSYLGLLVQQTIDSIRALAASGLKPTQISEKLGLPVENVVPYTSK